jgi:hypothetical protein
MALVLGHILMTPRTMLMMVMMVLSGCSARGFHDLNIHYVRYQFPAS